MIRDDEILERIVLEWNRDVRSASAGLTSSEARFLVDAYYSIQEHRIATNNQVRTPEGEPNAVLSFLSTQVALLEKRIQSALDTYTAHHPMGEWMRGVYGIGPVISAGLLAHIDITKAPTVGHIWRFAGLDPTSKWEKGQKRPWNARLKVLCWKAGESFVKFSNKGECYYGKVYLARKTWETEQNEQLAYAEQAKAILEARKIGKETEAYKAYIEGKLPPGQIHARAKRVAVKLFLSHMHHKWYELEYGTPPPMPYAITVLGHGHYLPPP